MEVAAVGGMTVLDSMADSMMDSMVVRTLYGRVL